MEIRFRKYHGAGNDFILLDNRTNAFSLLPQQVKHLCDRHLGIGADGLIELKQDNDHFMKMVYYNADGFEGSMCGNGARCFAAFLKDLDLITDKVEFVAADGLHKAFILKDGSTEKKVRVSLNDVEEVQKSSDYYFLNTGSPHYVEFKHSLKNFDGYNEGKKIRYSKTFQPDGTNVNFLAKTKTGFNAITYERGVEAITLSCGTGTTASAIAASLEYPDVTSPVEITSAGGKLSVEFTAKNGKYTNIWLTGPTAMVFEGTITLSNEK